MYEVIDVLAKAGYSITVSARKVRFDNDVIEVEFDHDIDDRCGSVQAETTRQALILFISDLLKASLEAE